MKIGNVKVKGKFVLAPIADVSDVAFRLLCKKYGASLCFTEMVSVNALVRNNKSTLKLTKVVDEERPVGVQLFGSKLDYFAKAVKMVNGDLVDLNLGCPATKILKQGSGGALLVRSKKIKDIVEVMVKEASVPVTVKIRSGLKHVNALQVAEIVEKAGASALTLHPRTVIQGYSGKADLELIKNIKEKLSIPLIGNGDIVDKESADRMLSTGCDLVMVGRAAMKDPSVFSRLGKGDKMPSYKDKVKMLFKYHDLAVKYEVFRFPVFKRRAMDFIKGHGGTAKVRDRLSTAKDIEEIRNILDK